MSVVVLVGVVIILANDPNGQQDALDSNAAVIESDSIEALEKSAVDDMEEELAAENKASEAEAADLEKDSAAAAEIGDGYEVSE